MTSEYWELSEFGSAYRTWRLRSRPQPDAAAWVKRWARRVTCEGPSIHAAPISDTGEDFMDWVEETNVFVTYVVSHRDRQVIVNDIG